MEKRVLFRSLFQLSTFGIFLFQMQISFRKFFDHPIIQEKSTVTLAGKDIVWVFSTVCFLLLKCSCFKGCQVNFALVMF